jgi:hypothetical protein
MSHRRLAELRVVRFQTKEITMRMERWVVCFLMPMACFVAPSFAQNGDPNGELPVEVVAPPEYLGYIEMGIFPNIRTTRLADWQGAPMIMEGEVLPSSSGRIWNYENIHGAYVRAAWNADSSLIYLDNSPGGTPQYVVLNANTFQPKYPDTSQPDIGCALWNGIRGDFRWHPNVLYKDVLINVHKNNNKLTWLNIASCSIPQIGGLDADAIIPDELVNGIGDFEGNPSADGRYLLLHNRTTKKSRLVDMMPSVPGTCPSGSTASGPFCFGPLKDISCGIGDPNFDGEECKIAHSSVSPSARYALVKYTVCSGNFDANGDCVSPNIVDDYLRIYDTDLASLTITERSSLPHPGCDGVQEPAGQGYIKRLSHEDMAPNPWDPSVDYVIGARRNRCFSSATPRVIMISLDSGTATPISMDSGSDEEAPHHVSARATNRPGWVFVTYRHDVNCQGPGSDCRHYQEIAALKMSPNREIERWAHHRSNVNTISGDDDEAQAVPRPDGQAILFRSAWNLMPGITCPGAPECGRAGELKPYLLYKSSGSGFPGGPCLDCNHCRCYQEQ